MVKWFVLMDILDKGVSLKNAETEIIIFDLLFKKILTEKFHSSIKIETDNWREGLYFYQIIFFLSSFR